MRHPFAWVLGAFCFLALVIFFDGVVSSQNWETNKEFWTKNSVKNLNERLDRFEKRLAKAERPRRISTSGDGDTRGSIGPRRPLTQQNHLHAHIDYLETIHRRPHESLSLFEYAWHGGFTDDYEELYVLWLAELKSTKAIAERAHDGQ